MEVCKPGEIVATEPTPTIKRILIRPAILVVSTVAIVIGGLLATTFAQTPGGKYRSDIPLPNGLPIPPTRTGTSGFVDIQEEFAPPTNPSKPGSSGFVTVPDAPPAMQDRLTIPKPSVPKFSSVPESNPMPGRLPMPTIPKPVSVPTPTMNMPRVAARLAPPASMPPTPTPGGVVIDRDSPFIVDPADALPAPAGRK